MPSGTERSRAPRGGALRGAGAAIALLALGACEGGGGGAPAALSPPASVPLRPQLHPLPGSGGESGRSIDLSPGAGWSLDGGRAEPDGAGGLLLSSEDAVRLVLPGPLDLELHRALRLELSAEEAASLQVRAVPWIGERRIVEPVTEVRLTGGVPQEVAVILPRAPEGGEPVDALHLVIKGEVQRPFRLEGLRLEWGPTAHWIRRIGGAGWASGGQGQLLALGEESRRARGVSRRHGLRSLPFEVPRGARLAFSHGASSERYGENANARLEVSIGDRRRAYPLTGPDAAFDRWAFEDLDLDELAGSRVELSFAVVAEGAGEVPCAVGDPVVYVPEPDPPTVVLVISDTHRADHLGAAAISGEGVTTPVLDALARRGLLFEDCYAASNITVPSHAALMTGTHPRDTGVADNATALAARAPTLAEAFREAGYLCFAATSVNLLAHQQSRLGQGFDRLSSPDGQRRAPGALADVRRWLPEAEGRALFLWVHLFDAHGPYDPPPPWDRRCWPAGADPADPSLPGPEVTGMRVPPWGEGVRDPEYLRALYRGEVGYLDEELGRALLHPRLASAVIAVTADHGECLGQHDIWWSHHDLYPDTLHVPLILAWPGAPAGRREAAPVRLIDLGRTLLELAGLSASDFPGRDLLASGGGRPRFGLAGGRQSVSVNAQGWHLILHLVAHQRESGRGARELHQVELFDLAADPGCERDLVDSQPGRAGELRTLLVRWLGRAQDLGWASRGDLDPEMARALAELGYADQIEDDWSERVLFDADCACPWCERFR